MTWTSSLTKSDPTQVQSHSCTWPSMQISPWSKSPDCKQDWPSKIRISRSFVHWTTSSAIYKRLWDTITSSRIRPTTSSQKIVSNAWISSTCPSRSSYETRPFRRWYGYHHSEAAAETSSPLCSWCFPFQRLWDLHYHGQPDQQLHGQESLKMKNVEFNITVPPCKLYIEYQMSKIKMRPYNSVQMSIRWNFSMYCIPNIT